MKIRVNRNIIWTEAFVDELAGLGVKYACISPGSRNTPLTVAFAGHKQITPYLLVDERSSGFFALGLAKASGSPIALICTSGTAAAEFYPAIIEAYQQHIPLIVCTADRPPELQNRGANQTIHQDGIYKNHICWSKNAGLPEVSRKKLNSVRKLAQTAFYKSSAHGPVHVNFPFRKPLEPFVFTDDVDELLLQKKNESIIPEKPDAPPVINREMINEVFSLLQQKKRILILSGPDEAAPDFPCTLQFLAARLNLPILADGASQLRNGSHSKQNIFVNFEGYLRSDSFSQTLQPEIILHFGKTMTSKGIEIFLEKTDAKYYLINKHGDLYDPHNKAHGVISMDPTVFCQEILKLVSQNDFSPQDSTWLELFNRAETVAEELKSRLIYEAPFPFEGRIIKEVISLMPENSNLMISNSMPVRDLDYFSPAVARSITVYNNRGASGIDGIASTALGIAAASGRPTVLLTGDLAFYYDMNGLLASAKYSIPLTIILINNNGGGIFEMLPISGYDKLFNEYFITPLNLDFSHFVNGFGGFFRNITGWSDFHNSFAETFAKSNFSVLQINTDSKKSAQQRKAFWGQVSASLT
ncbi:MAG: 2-succinyl-5-enolpyruvyl-6-hydroxy-3-cyclohexene-1-carboxylic-acid synthase [Ignavibacteriales bacterium]